MAFEDKKITCVQCGVEFVFTAGEQAFFAERGLESEPKRCSSCRRKKKKKSRYADKENDGIYRSPAFEGSAPKHQKIRRRHHGRREDDQRIDGQGGRAPRGRGQGQGRFGRESDRFPGEYRSPAFKEQDKIRPEEEYRAPGFQEYKNIDPSEEYRSPGFREYSDIDVNEEYRAPAYGGRRNKYRDERPLFHIVCPACGQEAMVPVLPDEREDDVLCQECYQKKRRQEYEERKAAAVLTAVSEGADAPEDEPILQADLPEAEADDTALESADGDPSRSDPSNEEPSSNI